MSALFITTENWKWPGLSLSGETPLYGKYRYGHEPDLWSTWEDGQVEWEDLPDEAKIYDYFQRMGGFSVSMNPPMGWVVISPDEDEVDPSLAQKAMQAAWENEGEWFGCERWRSRIRMTTTMPGYMQKWEICRPDGVVYEVGDCYSGSFSSLYYHLVIAWQREQQLERGTA